MLAFIAGLRADFQCRFTWSRFVRLAFENDAGDRVMLRVAESDQGRSYAALCSEFLRWPRKYEEGLTAPFLPDVDVVPTYCLANACTERF